MLATLSRRAFLGAELPGDADAFTPDGMWIAGVLPGGMAECAGLVGGDRVCSLAGHPVRTLAELAAALRAAGAAPRVELVVARGDETFTRTVDVITQPHEQREGARVDYGELDVGGVRLRTIATRTPSPRALVVVIQGIACESIDLALAPDAPLAGLVTGWARAGYDSLRVDKRGVGDSEGGPCPATDFYTELADARRAVELASRDAQARGIPLVVFGHSVGGIIAAAIAPALPLAGVIVYGTPVLRWLACLQESTRRQLELRGAPEAEIAARVAALGDLAVRGELNGRSAAYHAQLDAFDLEAAWREVTVPVLVVRGEHDWVVGADEQARIASLAHGDTTIVDVPGLDHLFGWHADREASLRDYGAGALDPVIVSVTAHWLDRLTSV